MSRIKNTLRMLDLLSTRYTLSAAELTRLLEVNERTLQRMRDDLIDLGYMIETVRGPGGGYRLAGTSKIALPPLDNEEQKNIRHGLQTVLSQKTEAVTDVTYEALSKLYHHFDQSNERILVQSYHTVKLNVEMSLYQNNISQLEDAIQKHRRVEIDYRKNPQSKKKYLFEPYELVLVNQLWYINGYEKNGRFLSLRVSRMLDVVLTEETYRYDEYYTSRNAVGNYGFRINPISLQAVITNNDSISEYIWGEKQKIKWLNDEQFEISIQFPNEMSAREFVLRAGSSIRLCSPNTLIEWYQSEIEKIVKTFE